LPAPAPLCRSFRPVAFSAIAVAVAIVLLTSASPAVAATGTLRQLGGGHGCFVDQSTKRGRCTAARALQGPASFTGSHAVDVSPDGRNVYVTASTSNAVAEFRRNPRTGALTQPSGAAGCISAKGNSGCARAAALRKPVSVAVSPDGKNVYVAAMQTSAVVTMARTGGVLRETGCVSAVALPGCTTAPALFGADVVVVSPDGRNVYAGAFGQAAVQVFDRDLSTGGLTPSSCIAGAIDGCAPASLLDGPEGMAISHDGANVYVGAAIAGAVVVLDRAQSTGALTQAPAPDGCLTVAAASGCTTVQAVQGADAVAVSGDDTNVYVAAGLQNGFAAFARDTTAGTLTQLQDTAGCFLAALAQACGLGRAFGVPEGVAISADGDSVYVGAFGSSAVDSFSRDASGGALTQLRGKEGCSIASPYPTCRTGRALGQANAVALSPDGRNLYVGAFSSNALAVFRRTT
jgi:DNA-binding beta-propeller fold protein YncE